MMDHLVVYAGLFVASLAAATILPFQSEVALVSLLLAEHYSPWLLVSVASVGKYAGIGRQLGARALHRAPGEPAGFPVERQSIARAEAWYHPFGRWSLLLSWAPFIGDPLTIVAGVLREPLPVFVVLVAVAKTARYVAVVAIARERM
jgi:membrane protein YqaA with SNARE-associated domain